jgi:hypothetical protein
MGRGAARGWLCLALLGGCTAYNECKEQRGQTVGYTAVELDLRESGLRYREMPMGNLVADSFHETATANCGGGVACPDFAMENAGAIRSFTEDGCSRRQAIAQGPITDTDLASILPFATNQVLMVDVTGADLKLILEHAVDRLGDTNTTDIGGWFMQVSHLRFTVDCTGARQVLSSDGMQVLEPGTRVTQAEVARDTVGGTVWEAVDLAGTTRVYRVLVNSFEGTAHDGHLGFAQRDGSGRVLTEGGKVRLNHSVVMLDQGQPYNDAHAVTRYVRQRAAAGEDVAPLVEGRINILRSCFRRPE